MAMVKWIVFSNRRQSITLQQSPSVAKGRTERKWDHKSETLTSFKDEHQTT
jgi:hypothetical protein